MARRALILLEGDIQYSTGNGLLYVQAAQRLGLHPITLSADPAQYSYLAAGCEAIPVDTSNYDALIRECSRLGETYDIAGITSVNESVYATVGNLCRHFDLPGPNPVSIERCCNKFTQRQLLEKARVPIPAYRLVENATDVERAAAEIGLPVVVKPAVGIGSSGVRLCRNLEEVAEHTTYLLGGKHRWRSSPRILVEEFAQGSHYYAKIMGNEVLAIAAASFGPAPHFVYSEVAFPAPLADHEHERIVDISLGCLRALELGWGPTGIEFRWTKRGPVVIEVNPRAGGFPDPQLVQLAYGIDLVTEHLKLVIGEESDLRRTRSHAAAARILLPDRDGTLDWINGVSRAAAIPGIEEVKLYVEPKTPIIRMGDYRDWLGHVIASSSNPTQTEAILRHAVDLIGWSITPFPTLGE
ncbi:MULTISPECIES: acetyl-CoA carboxylase biotin carboxylase subunit family protein [unclassified Mesorhizobium]|uniref:ATP-grasp domain-containing protein n=1 Tax=unclassified Mesorhizobium TaxID=325217 RepID=UPI000FD30E42|nr:MULTISPECIES: acetyl-CoA carboxylase biotin carboxylase subunit family protein [unclassified Mesorhizobium]RUV06018.1 ATP-grasp domain-containing protein [Mesorhizobium sp. M1A.F.Ca.IN.020.03.2.1]RWG87130.1 MAG: ATP-grasp domain-containing protein [Mesorhizobium sp.]RWK18232.1 MAG: ATP-grasp domain-containing protein [Mesorhizobium sp.]